MRNAPGNTGTRASGSSITSILNTWRTVASRAIAGNAQPASVLRSGEMDMTSRYTCGTTIGNKKVLLDDMIFALPGRLQSVSQMFLV